MAFFQNLFNQEFIGNWVLSDRQYSLTFKCPANQNSSDYQYAHNNGPWDFSTNGVLSINYSIDDDFKNYAKLEINIAGSTAASTTAYEVSNILNSDETFSSMFIAEINKNLSSVLIKSNPRRIRKDIKMWISNTGAETKMKFNKKAGVAELPNYFKRHTIDNSQVYADSAAQLILLDENNPIDAQIIEDAGFKVANMKEDWELLEGRSSGLFTFKKTTIDGSNRITQMIEYPAGAKAGDFARKVIYSYSGSSTSPYQVIEIPYVLDQGDMISP